MDDHTLTTLSTREAKDANAVDQARAGVFKTVTKKLNSDDPHSVKGMLDSVGRIVAAANAGCASKKFAVPAKGNNLRESAHKWAAQESLISLLAQNINGKTAWNLLP